ncbi:MAG: choice-of-anchor J domain-containing protein [Bacteroidales bacterium]|nr:choice-of-anchor J domain-containing protein [Bacteroidales bacterium]
MISNRQKKKRLFVRTLVMTLFMALFTQIAQAQVYMHNGSSYAGTSGVKFYDSGGPSKGPANYWLHWFGRNQEFTYTFNPEQNGYAMQVDFEAFTAYTDNNGANDAHALNGNFALRLNNAELSIYEGDAVNPNKLITTLTGTIIEPFTVMANGPITFYFKSYGFTEEGWGATVKAIPASSYELQKPAISMEVCSDLVVLYPTTLGASIRYTTGNPNNNNPSATNGTLYTEPFSVTYPTTVKAVTVNGNNASEVADKTYNATDATPVPNINNATIERDGNTIIITPPTVPDHLNETYAVIYTTAASGNTPEDPVYLGYQNPNNVGTYVDPDGWNGSMPGLVHFEWTTPNTNFKFCIVAKTCVKQSVVRTYQFGKLQVPDPTIDITDNGNNTGKADISWTSGYTIRYTIDGSEPSTTNGTLVTSGTTVTVNNSLTPGQTVKVVAYKVTNGSVDTNYEPSDVVSEMYLPGGGASGTYGGTVILNDFEDHSWSYYSDATNPIRSLNPADVKITYYGNGKMYTSTGATPSGNLSDATGVKVGPSENEDTFIYLKTLERANGDAGTGNLAYTLIPNPFSVRPKFTSGGTTYYTGFYGWRVKSLNGVTINGYNVGSIIPAETEIQFVTDNSEGNEVEFEAVWARAYVTNSTSTSGLNANVSYERNFMVLGSNPGTQSQTITLGSGNSTTSGRNVPLYINRAYGYGYSLSQQIYTASEIGSSGSITSLAFRVNNAQSSNRTLHIYLTSTTNTDFDYDSDWGAYASVPMSASGLVFSGTVNFNQTGWKTITLDTPFEYDGSSNIIVTVFDATGTYMDTSPRFYTYSGNAVYNSRTSAYTEEGYYFAMNHITYKPQIQFTIASSPLSGLNVPLTVTAYNPDGTGGSSTVALSNGINCAADLKIENIRLNSMSQLTANGHNLVIGRGVTGEVSHIRGMSSGSSSAVNYTIRLESGTFGQFDLIDSDGYTFGNTVSTRAVFGCDYDRAKNDNSKLNIAPSGTVYGGNGLHSFTSANNRNNITYDWLIKSGKVQGVQGVEDANAQYSIYMGNSINANNSNSVQYCGKRRLVMEGGEIASIAGGVNCYGDNYANYGVNDGSWSVLIRIKGGTANGSIYGAAAYAGASGDRRFVLTNGTVKGWIAGGANGVQEDGGVMYGNSYVYVGGKTQVNSSGSTTVINRAVGGNVFGAGCGYNATSTSGQVTAGTNVVIADEAYVERGVYGGGSYGYTEATANVHVLGGTIGCVAGGVDGESYVANIKGGVFGGACQNKGGITNVTVKDGTVNGDVYGGSNYNGEVANLATVNVSGGTVQNVFGGGLGANTNMAAGTSVNISGGIINNNVYGGGEEGTVTGNTDVKVSGGTMKDVYGAGKGVSGTTGSKATITGQTFVEVTGGTIANVYGGGENGNIGAESAVEPGLFGTLTYDFADGTLGNWTTIDADGDNYNWQATTDFDGHNGTGVAASASFINNVGALTPDNYLVSPRVNLGGSISFWACAQDGNYSEEHFGLFVSTTDNNASSFVLVNEWTLPANGNKGPEGVSRGGNRDQGTWHQFSANLSAYSGKAGYIAIRHFNCTDEYWLLIDDIEIIAPEQQEVAVASTVTINGGNISENVFGGGAYGTTAGSTIVNVKNGSVHGSVYGGALGNQGSVYVAGSHTVNVLGGRVYSNVYGGSRNADDALSFDPGNFADADDDETVCAVNISGGQIDQQVYAAGYYGNCFGSVYAFIGKDAIYNAPHHVETAGQESAAEPYEIAKLSITGSVWAGGDWGKFDGTFGAPTISGNSNVYIDGQDYITNTSDKNTVGYMGIDGSVFGSGTSCDAGKKEHTVMLRNYGESSDPFNSTTRNFASIQRADYLVLDNVHLDFQGQGLVNSLNVTELYSIYEVSEAVIVTGGSTLIMDAPIDQIKSFWSASCSDVFTADLPTSQTAVGGYTAITPSTLSATPNKVRVNGGNYIKVYHDKQIATTSGNTTSYTAGYGMLNGYAYMMASSGDNEATCAYARPRWCTGAPFAMNNATYDNRNDGGWVSYVSGDNVFALDGTKVTSGGVQMEYENHTPGSKVGEAYFRIWRTTGEIHEREGVFDVVAHGEDEFKYVDVEIELPAWRGHDYYYMFQTQGQGSNLNTTIDYGTELMVFNTALYDNNSWMTYDVQGHAQKLEADTDEQAEIKKQPEVNYGLVILPGTGNALSSPQIDETAAPALIINNDADAFLASQNNGKPVNSFTFTDNTEMPTVTFRLTYSDLLNSNKTYEPIWVNLVQCDKDGNVKDIVKVKLIINTSTVVGRDFKAQVYAVMNGNGSTAEESHVQIVLPRFTLNQGGVDSHFTVESIEWTPANTTDGAGQLVTVASNAFDKTKFAVEFSAADNYDGTTGWNELNYTIYDTKVLYGPPATTPKEMGTTSARTQFSFDFNLYYNGNEEIDIDKPELLGTIVYNMKFTNYGTTSESDPLGHETFTITIEVYRRGKGTRYYLDGVNGKNSNTGTFPDQAMLTLSALFNRSGFLPGDEIYVVNQVTAEDELEWNGLAKGGNVLIYRYNGGHALSGEDAEIIGNEDNTAYTGALINVPNGATMTIHGITLDGYYNNGGDGSDYSTVASEAALITVQNGGTLELNQNTTLQQNYNHSEEGGGAVYVYQGGTLMMNEDAHIANNKTEYDGAGVYMNGTMIVSDKVVVWDNLGNGNTQNNVYLASKESVVQIGVDADSEHYQDLAYDAENADESAKIGVTKSTSNFTAGVAEVVYSAETGWLEEPLATQAIIVHDGNIYKLETGASANMLYWRDTWVTFVTSQPEGFNINNIDSEEDLAWLISLVNGENNQTANTFENQTVVVKKNLDMGAHTWVPIGERNNVFKGTFEGNGYTIEGLNSSLNRTDLGMFGIAEGATIQNVIAQGTFDGIANNYGTIAGTMKGGTISNVEAAGTLTGDANYAQNIGGLVGVTETGTTIHSSFAVNTLTAQRDETVVGGLVAQNGGDLYNSYANVTITGTDNTPIGGLVGVNDGTVENCYVVLGSQTFPAFAATNNNKINYCYADKQQTSYVGSGTDPVGSGYYAAVVDRKAIGYMYADNKVNATNDYVVNAISYANNHIDKWPGLLSTLNQWVKAKSNDNITYTSWLRPTSANINGDLPVLTFATGNSLGTTDGKFLKYAVTSETDNGLDALLELYNGKTSYIFLYDNATEVTKVPATRTYVFINEDAVLLQKQGAKGDFINATVGVSFDNSCKTAVSTGDPSMPLNYDWHLMSSPLSNAPMGLSWSEGQVNWWDTQDWDDAIGQVTGVSNSYMPDGTDNVSHWDFYTYYEPEYHWINFKRNSSSHAHYEEPHGWISYSNEANLVPGKGYMAAIDQDSYLSNTGTLNNGDVPIKLTYSNDGTGLEEPTKDWGSNLVGNPYQAYLDLNAVADGTGYTKFYIYSAETNQYVPFTTGQSSNTWTPSQFIHPHQAFFVLTDATDGKFKFTYDMATADKNSESYFRKGAKIDYPLINLFAKNEAGALNYTIIEVGRPELGGAERTEALKTTDFDLYAHYGQNDYKLLFTPEEAQRVAVFFNAKKDGTYTLSWDTQNGEFSFLRLIDNITGVEVDMLNNDHYTFEGHATDYASRFYILFNNPNVEPGGNANGYGNGNFAYNDGYGWIVNGEGLLELIDVTGRVLYRQYLAGDMNRVHLDNYKTGVYVLKLGDMTQKIIIK